MSRHASLFRCAAAVVAAGVCQIGALRLEPVVAAQIASSSGPSINKLTPAEAAAGWKLLFDGSSMSGWSPTGTADWKTQDGVLTFTTGRGMLQTAQSYSNFQLTLEFWEEKNANSGVFIRCTVVEKGNACYEINIFDLHETAPTGSIILVEPGKAPTPAHSVLPERPQSAEKWNTYDITAEGNHLVVKLNGKTMSDIREDKLKLSSGAIQLQAGGPDGPGLAKFRSIKLRVL